MICLPFDDNAAAIFDRLRAQKIRVGTNDFERVSDLLIEDWTK